MSTRLSTSTTTMCITSFDCLLKLKSSIAIALMLLRMYSHELILLIILLFIKKIVIIRLN